MDRPYPPPESILNGGYAPSIDVELWLKRNIVTPGGALYNPDHIHLAQAVIGVLWAGEEWRRKGSIVLGSAEVPQPRESGWRRGRFELQMREWFGTLPDFVITLYAPFCATASNINFCALLEHELYHCAQAQNEFGAPRFNRDTGYPVYTLAGHDVEEFLGVVRRYGIDGVANQRLRAMVKLAGQRPEVGAAQIAGACGNCNVKLVS